jgi:hypothetical protein
MKSSVSHGSPRLTARLQVLALLAGLSVPVLSGCPGALEGSGWPMPTGSGGMTGTGTGGSGTGTGGGGAGPCDAPAMVFPSCISAACHKPTGGFGPDLSPAGLAGLTTMTTLFSTGPCAGKTFITPADKANSPLLKKVQGDTCGAQMPYMMPPLPTDQINCIVGWVNSQ